MSVSIAAVRAGIAANLTAAFPTVNVSPYLFPSPDPPCMDVMPNGTVYDQAMKRGADTLELLVRVMVSWADPVAAQTNLDAYCATGSGGVKAAIEADATLGGVVSWCRVTEVSPYKEYTPAAGSVQTKLGVEFTLEVMP